MIASIRRPWFALILFVAAPLGSLEGQGFLDEFSYEGLRLSGLSLEFGVVTSDRLTTEPTGAVRVDLGRLAPRVRVLVGGSYFKGDFDLDEVTQFENRLRGIVSDPTNDFEISVGSLTWTNIEFDLDLQYVYDRASWRVLPYIGLGIGVHVRNGNGDAIDGTFVEDALDTVAAGLNLSGGLEFRVLSQVDFLIDLRGLVSSELLGATARGGFKFSWEEASP